MLYKNIGLNLVWIFLFVVDHFIVLVNWKNDLNIYISFKKEIVTPKQNTTSFISNEFY